MKYDMAKKSATKTYPLIRCSTMSRPRVVESVERPVACSIDHTFAAARRTNKAPSAELNELGNMTGSRTSADPKSVGLFLVSSGGWRRGTGKHRLVQQTEAFGPTNPPRETRET